MLHIVFYEYAHYDWQIHFTVIAFTVVTFHQLTISIKKSVLRNTDGCAEKVYECARCLFFLKYVARRKESAVSASFNSLTFLFLHLIQFYSQNSIMYFYSQSCVDSNEIYRARNDIVRHYRLNKCNITIWIMS